MISEAQAVALANDMMWEHTGLDCKPTAIWLVEHDWLMRYECPEFFSKELNARVEGCEMFVTVDYKTGEVRLAVEPH